MRIAIIGAGFAGCAIGTLLKDHEVTLFEDGLPHASNIAAGLLHKFVGQHAKKNPLADEAYKAALDFIEEHAPHALRKEKILRLAYEPDQITDFKLAHLTYPEAEWIDDASSLGPYPKVAALIVEGAIVDCPLYLSTLKKKLNVVLRKIENLNELKEFDKIILACGPTHFAEGPKLNTVKGQLLEFPFNYELPYPINSKAYLITHDNKAVLGSTFEHTYIDNTPDFKTAFNELNPHFKRAFPHLEIGEAVVKSALRVTTPNRLPVAKKLDEKTYLLKGFGARGLLYHVYFAKQLFNLIV